MIRIFFFGKKKPLTASEAANKRRVYIFTLCILCSALFWLFNKLTQETSAEFYKIVKFNAFPNELLPASLSDSLIKYKVQATGIRLISNYFFSKTDTITISADALPVINREGKQYHYVTEARLSEMLSESIVPGASMLNIRPDSLFLELVPAVEKMLPVKLNAEITFEQRFRQYGELQVNPDSVLVKGPKTIVDTLHYVSTEFWKSGKLRQSSEKLLRLENLHAAKSLQFDQELVRVVVPVAEYTESSIELPIEIDCPDNIEPAQIRLFPNKAHVSYLVALQDYRKVSENMFSALVVCPQSQPNSDGRLEVQLEAHPSFVQILAIRPAVVEYIILE